MMYLFIHVSSPDLDAVQRFWGACLATGIKKVLWEYMMIISSAAQKNIERPMCFQSDNSKNQKSR